MTPSLTACPRCGQEFTRGEAFCPRDGARVMPLNEEARASDDADPLIGQLLSDRYRVLRRIGEGGMGRVYEVRHVLIDKPMALKVLREDFSHRPEVVARFRQEAKSASRIGHAHIVDISDFGVTPAGAHFFVMELLHGRDLADELERCGALPTRRALAIVRQCAEALAAAHDKGIVHRDIKPENIFLVHRDAEADFVKLVDFGIAKFGASDPEERRLTQTGVIFGTPEYMAPEQASGQPLDHRIDIYALGIILFELLTGRVPFMGDTFMGILAQHAYDDVPPLKALHPGCFAPPAVEQLVMRALAKRPDDRYPTMRALADDLARLVEALGPRDTAAMPGTVAHQVLAAAPASWAPVVSDHAAQRARASATFRRLSGAAAVALFVLAGSLLLTRSHGAPPVPHPPAPPVLPVPAARVPATAEETAGVHDADDDDDRIDVLVEVQTAPEGASVVVEGRVGCAATPCRVRVPRGTPQRITARKPGFLPSTIEVRPSAEMAPVALVLRRREAPLPGHRMQGDLLLPDAFGKR